MPQLTAALEKRSSASGVSASIFAIESNMPKASTDWWAWCRHKGAQLQWLCLSSTGGWKEFTSSLSLHSDMLAWIWSTKLAKITNEWDHSLDSRMVGLLATETTSCSCNDNKSKKTYTNSARVKKRQNPLYALSFTLTCAALWLENQLVWIFLHSHFQIIKMRSIPADLMCYHNASCT